MPPSAAAWMARTESASSCGPQLTHHSPGREPIGAVPMPTREIRRSLGPRRRRSMTMCNEVRLARMPIVRPDEGVRYDGLPWGYELGSLVGGVVEAGREEPTLSADSLAALEELDRDLTLDVFVTPT